VQVFTDAKYITSSGFIKTLLFLRCKFSKFGIQVVKKYTIQLQIKERQRFWSKFWNTALGWISRKAFGDRKFLHNIEDDSYEEVINLHGIASTI
jgi:hypothetical protein